MRVCKILNIVRMLLVPALSFVMAANTFAAELEQMVEELLPSLEVMYKNFHANPELSFYEQESAGKVATELEKMGYKVSFPVGEYANQLLTCYGVVALLENGSGPVVLIRGDMDALPLQEKTGLAWASEVRMNDHTGAEQPVMHACGHDIHMSVLLGTAQIMAKTKDQWKGTLIIVAQPAEEMGAGARGLIAGGLYESWPVPDYALAEHVDPMVDTGKIGYRAGYAMANVSSVDITVKGVGAHGARPHQGRDPVVIASQIVLSLQTIVSREINPVDVGVVTVGSIHGGTKHNIIPDEVKLQLTVRSFEQKSHLLILDSIKRIAVNTARAAGVPEDRLPEIKSSKDFLPSLYNDPQLTARMVRAAADEIGGQNAVEIKPTTGGEDFSRFGLTEHKVPIFMFRLGTGVPGSDVDSRPGLHSPYYHPVVEQSLVTGVRAMCAMALELMGK